MNFSVIFLFADWFSACCPIYMLNCVIKLQLSVKATLSLHVFCPFGSICLSNIYMVLVVTQKCPTLPSYTRHPPIITSAFISDMKIWSGMMRVVVEVWRALGGFQEAFCSPTADLCRPMTHEGGTRTCSSDGTSRSLNASVSAQRKKGNINNVDPEMDNVCLLHAADSCWELAFSLLLGKVIGPLSVNCLHYRTKPADRCYIYSCSPGEPLRTDSFHNTSIHLL